MTLESYKSKVKDEIERAQLVNKEIRQRVNVSSAEIKRYYEAHHSDYATGEKVKVRAIYLRVEDPGDAEAMARARAQAMELRANAPSSNALQALPKEHTEGPGAEQGGERGTCARGD
jgi:citrate lyase gamma subunit